jgi:hypothetical protein
MSHLPAHDVVPGDRDGPTPMGLPGLARSSGTRSIGSRVAPVAGPKCTVARDLRTPPVPMGLGLVNTSRGWPDRRAGARSFPPQSSGRTMPPHATATTGSARLGALPLGFLTAHRQTEDECRADQLTTARHYSTDSARTDRPIGRDLWFLRDGVRSSEDVRVRLIVLRAVPRPDR